MRFTAESRARAPYLACLAMLMLAGAVLRFWGLREQGMLFTAEERNLLVAESMASRVRAQVGFEGLTPSAETQSLLTSLPPPVADGTDSGWSALLALVMCALGDAHEGTGRFAAAVLGVALIAVGYATGYAWFQDRAGALALAAVCAFLPSFVWWGRLGLSHSLFLLLAFTGLATLLRATGAGGLRAALASGTAFGVAAVTDADAWLLVAGAAVFLVLAAALNTERRPALHRLAVWALALGTTFAVVTALAGRGAPTGAASPGETAAVPYMAYWFFRREGPLACLLLVVGVPGMQRLAGSRRVFFVLLLLAPVAVGMRRVGNTALPTYPFVTAYVAVAMWAAAGLHVLLTLRPKALRYGLGTAAVLLLGAWSAPLVRTRSGTRDAAAWLTRDAHAWWHSQGADKAALLIAGRIVPPVQYATHTVWRRAWWNDPPAEARRILQQTSAYLFLVGEEGHLLPEWSHILPMQRFTRRLPRPALYVSETGGTTEAKRARLDARAFEQLAAYDAAVVAAHAHDAGPLLPVAAPYTAALEHPTRFSVDPLPPDPDRWQQEFRLALAQALGFHAIQRAPQLHARPTDRTRAAGYVRERVELEVEPGFSVPAFVLLPQGPGPHPFVLTLHGHGPGKGMAVGLTAGGDDVQATETERRDLALQLVQRGYGVIAPDQRGFGELRLPGDVERGVPFSCARLQARAQVVGRSLLGDRVYDAMRWIDYAATRDDLDTSRIIVAGHSAGGTTALFTAALDERVDVAFVSGYFGTLAGTLGRFDLCECNYAPGLARMTDIADVAALVAPRRLRLSLGRLDGVYPAPIAGAALARTQRLFAARGGRVDLTLGDLGHVIYPEQLWELLDEADGAQPGTNEP